MLSGFPLSQQNPLIPTTFLKDTCRDKSTRSVYNLYFRDGMYKHHTYQIAERYKICSGRITTTVETRIRTRRATGATQQTLLPPTTTAKWKNVTCREIGLIAGSRERMDISELYQKPKKVSRANHGIVTTHINQSIGLPSEITIFAGIQESFCKTTVL